MSKEINIDIGGGERAEFFVSLASQDRNSLYIVLDPKRFRCPYINLYHNLHLIRWGSGITKTENNWELPFQDASINNAYLNNIYGVMDEAPSAVGFANQNERTVWDYNDKDMYARVASSLKRVMKSSGVVHVQETQVVIPIVRQIYLEQGFKIIDGPRKTLPVDFTSTSSMLLHFAENEVEKYKINLDESIYLPMGSTVGLT